MNAYYGNLIEGHNNRPRDIERALAGEPDGESDDSCDTACANETGLSPWPLRDSAKSRSGSDSVKLV